MTKGKKRLIIALAIIMALISFPFIFLKLAFGPLHDSLTIDLGIEGELLCDEIYNGDFAREFYHVKMIFKTRNGKRQDIGSVMFDNQNWKERIVTIRVGDWLAIPLESENFVQIKILNTVSGKLNDTTLQPFDLRKDLPYKRRFKDRPDHLYQGNSNIQNIAGKTIEVNYEYKTTAEALYPSAIIVNQKVVYEISHIDGKLLTKAIHDRELP